jgi:thiamine-phosphate pyrophosphorylase
MSARRASFRLYLITDRKLARDGDLIAACEAGMRAADESGARGQLAIQIREKDLTARALYELALKLRELCRRYGAPMFVNDRIDVAMAVGADGVHLPADSFSPTDARKLLGPHRLIGVSTHGLDEVLAAADTGADFVVYGPVFAPISKSSYGPPQGVDALRETCARSTIPVFALGGINAERARELAGAGAAGVAAIGAVMGAEHPGAAVRSLLEAVAGWR